MARSAWTAIALAVALALGGWVLWWRLEDHAPAIDAPDEIYLGRAPKTIAVELRDQGSGLRSVRAVLAHNKGEVLLLEKRFPGSLWSGGGVFRERVELAPDAEALGLSDGDARLRIEVRDWSWREGFDGNETRREVALHVDRRPPRVTVRSGLTYVRRGGAGLAVYRVGEPTVRDGVDVAGRFFPGIEWPGACPEEPAGCRVALFAVPIDAPAEPQIRVVAEDASGNAASAAWATRLQEREIPRVEIELTQAFLDNKVRELAEAFRVAAASPVAAFQEINSAQRARDEARIRELTSGVSGPPLWQGAFEQLADSEVTSVFPERRFYRHGGHVVSEATHYGFDLASLAGAAITASNAGRVIFAGPLGIYGDTVLVDHGLGVVSLYGHLQAFEVQEGDEVAKGQRLGLSGQTGLAGGDHLHFAILVSGSYVDPREWWDAKWVREHVDAILAR